MFGLPNLSTLELEQYLTKLTIIRCNRKANNQRRENPSRRIQELHADLPVSIVGATQKLNSVPTIESDFTHSQINTSDKRKLHPSYVVCCCVAYEHSILHCMKLNSMQISIYSRSMSMMIMASLLGHWPYDVTRH